MMMQLSSIVDLKPYERFLSEKRSEINLLTKDIDGLRKELSRLSQLSLDLTQCRDIMNRVGLLAQVETKNVIESLVTQALQLVFGSEYSFEMDSVIQRNKPEVNFYVTISERRHLLKGELGGGVVDLVAFCLRVVLWAISSPRTEPVLVLDEPLKFVDKTRLEQVGIMVKKLSSLLGVQFIIVTHEDALADVADRTFSVDKVRGVSKVVMSRVV